jgi:hypothetical protein
MGCSDSKANVDDVRDAGTAYQAADKGVKADPMCVGVMKGDASLTREARIGQLETIFDAVDDDKSGGVSMAEFAQIFNQKVEGVRDNLRGAFVQMDSDERSSTAGDGVVSKKEFVAFHLKKFEKLDDDAFTIITGRLLTLAEDEVVNDASPAVPKSQNSFDV